MNGALLCLATEKGYGALQAALEFKESRPLFICTLHEKGVTESFEERIKSCASEAGLTIARWRDFKADAVPFLKSNQISSVLCIGWQYLVPDEAINHLGGEVIVAHDSLLPRFRGFAPLPSAMIAGETETGVTFLRAGSGIDDGDILWQDSISIGATDTIGDLISRITPLYKEGIRRYLSGELIDRRPQDHTRATHSIWRDEEDYWIDWQWAAQRIDRTVRALGPPYLGARTGWNDKTIIIEQTRVEPDIQFEIRQPGKIWNLDSEGRPLVVCGQGMLRILSARVGDESILPMSRLRQRFVNPHCAA